MRPFIDEICDYISGGLGIPYGDTNNAYLRIGDLQQGVDGVIAIAMPSETPDLYTDVEYYSIDFWASNRSSARAYSDLQRIYKLLHQGDHYLTDNFEVYFSHALGQIEDLDRDGAGSKVLRLGIRFIVRNLIS